jgi:predicted HAD superfamily hydrolase
VEAGDAIDLYRTLRERLEGARSVNMLQEYDPARGAIPKGAVQVSKKNSESNDLLDLSTLAVRLMRARAEDPIAFMAFVLWHEHRWSIRKLTSVLRATHLPVGRKMTSILVKRGRNNIKTHVEDL